MLDVDNTRQLINAAVRCLVTYQEIHEWLGDLVDDDPEVAGFLVDLDDALEHYGGYYCGSCGHRCYTITIDERFDYEYGSIHGTHGEVWVGSYCCEAGLYYDGLLTQEAEVSDHD